MEFYNSSFSACEDARGYSPENHQRITRFRTRARPAGVSGIFQFLFSACGTHAGTPPSVRQIGLGIGDEFVDGVGDIGIKPRINTSVLGRTHDGEASFAVTI